MQFDVGADECRGELGVCGGSGSGAPDLGRDVVQFLAVLLGLVWWVFSFVWKLCWRTLSATIGPLVALVSAAIWFIAGQFGCRSLWENPILRRIAYHDAIIKSAADNCRSGAGCFG